MTSQSTILHRAFESEQPAFEQANGYLENRYRTVRAVTRSLAARTSAEDQMAQSCAEASPVKWHQAHTTWFVETFVLRPFLPGHGSGRRALIRAIRATSLFLAPWANTTASLCPAR